MAKPNSKKSVELIEGSFWLLGSEEEVVDGTVIFEPSNTRLVTNRMMVNGITSINHICGTLSTGDNVVLYQCEALDHTLYSGPSGKSWSSFDVGAVFSGIDIHSDGEPLLSSVAVRFDDENIFSGKSPIKFDLREAKIEIDKSSITSLVVRLDEQTELTIEQDITFNGSGVQSPEIGFKHGLSYVFTFSEPKTWVSIRINYVRRLLQFIMLGSRSIVPVAQLYYKDKAGTFEAFEDRLFRGQHKYLTQNYETYFNIESLGSNLENALQKWFDKSPNLNHALNSFFAKKEETGGYTEETLLGYARTLELLSGIVCEKKSNEFDLAKESLMGFIEDQNWEDETKSRFLGMVKGLNRSTFQDGLQEICKKFESVLDPFLDISKFPAWVSGKRNFYTHYSKPSAKIRRLNPLALIEQMELVIECCLLSLIGFSCEDISEMFAKRADSKIFKSVTNPLRGDFGD